MATYVGAALILKPGDQVLVTDPSYFMADAVFRQLGAQLVRVPVDAEGMDIKAVQLPQILNIFLTLQALVLQQ